MIRYCIDRTFNKNKEYEILEFVLNSNDHLKVICRDIQNNTLHVLNGDYIVMIDPPKTELRNIKLYSILNKMESEELINIE